MKDIKTAEIIENHVKTHDGNITNSQKLDPSCNSPESSGNQIKVIISSLYSIILILNDVTTGSEHQLG